MYPALILLGIILLIVYYLRSDKSDYPPGPWGLPIVGHLPLLGHEYYKTLLQMKKKYGPILSVKFGSLPIVVLQDDKIIKEVFSQNVFSGRPATHVTRTISLGHRGLTFGRADAAADQRNFVMRTLRDFGYGRVSMEDKIMEEIDDFVADLKQETKAKLPVPMNDRFKASVINSFCSIFMSRRFKRTDPEFKHLVHSAHKAYNNLGLLGEMAFYIPWVAKLFLNYSGLGKKIQGFHEVYKFTQAEVDRHNETRVPGEPRDLTDLYLDKVDATTDETSSFHISQKFQNVTMGDFFLGALDTTSVALEWFTIHLVRNPKIQQKLYDEVSRITSSNSRSPCLKDRALTPYFDAAIHELIRLSTVGPIGLLHRTMEDAPVRNFLLPKGTLIMSNLYGIHHDTEYFDEPEEFRPERFLKEDEDEPGQLKMVTPDGYLPFSIGKRICPGPSLALDTLFLFTTNLVQKFHFECEKGRMPTLDMIPGLICLPLKFKLNISPRSGMSDHR